MTVNGSGGGSQGPAGPAGPTGPTGATGDGASVPQVLKVLQARKARLVRQGPQGAPGSDAEGVTGGSDHSPFGNASPAFLSATPAPLTTDNIATGFSGYMVWANVALQFNTGNPASGTAPSPSSAGCSIIYTVDGRAGSFVADGRNVSYPMNLIGDKDRIVQFSLGLNGLVGADLTPPLAPTETVNISLMCNAPGPTPTGRSADSRYRSRPPTGASPASASARPSNSEEPDVRK